MNIRTVIIILFLVVVPVTAGMYSLLLHNRADDVHTCEITNTALYERGVDQVDYFDAVAGTPEVPADVRVAAEKISTTIETTPYVNCEDEFRKPWPLDGLFSVADPSP